MGRLIDADKLLETLQDLEPHCENKDYEYGMLNTMRYYMTKIINDEPTAYDVDNVVSEIRRASGNGYRDIDGDYVPPMIETKEAIEIVKQGCVSSDNVCEWKYINDFELVSENHESKCIEGYDYKYCPYCGKKIKAGGKNVN